MSGAGGAPVRPATWLKAALLHMQRAADTAMAEKDGTIAGCIETAICALEFALKCAALRDKLDAERGAPPAAGSAPGGLLH